MEVKNTKIKGLFLFKFDKFEDDRGLFVRNFCKKELDRIEADTEIAQANLSFNKKMGTLRGFHYQFDGFEEAKTVTVLSGAIHYKVIDLRKDSPTYTQSDSFDLNQLEWTVQVPKGCIPAFQTLTDNVLLHYYVSQFYNPDKESGIRYNDPFFDLKWPVEVTEISERDSNFPNFNLKNFKGLLNKS